MTISWAAATPKVSPRTEAPVLDRTGEKSALERGYETDVHLDHGSMVFGHVTRSKVGGNIIDCDVGTAPTFNNSPMVTTRNRNS